jgi:uncharacterized protein (TIGR03437 family)
MRLIYGQSTSGSSQEITLEKHFRRPRPLDCAGETSVKSVILFALIPCAFGQQPAIQSIQNAASSVAAPVVPQMLVVIRGSNLSAQTVAANDSPLPANLGGTIVTFNGIAAPLLYVSPDQINAQVPSGVGVPLPATASVIVSSSAGASTPFPLAVTGVGAPGIFTQDTSGCGQAVALNVHADGSVTMNTPDSSLDPVNDVGLRIFMTGMGSFADRIDGVPWQFNSADSINGRFTPLLGIRGLYGITTDLRTTYTGPSPGTVGVDQLDAAFFRGPFATPSIEGCRIPMSVTLPQISGSQYVNVSVHSGGGKCVDAAPDSLGTVSWEKTATSDTSGISSQLSAGIQFLQAAGLAFQQFSFFPSTSGEGVLPIDPSFCAASYPATLPAGAITISGPGLGPVSLDQKDQNGVLSYQKTLDPASSLGGAYTVTASGARPGVGQFTARANLPTPITITTDVSPGTVISIPFTVNWTGGDSTSGVNVQLAFHDPTQPAVPTLFAGARASARTVTLTVPPLVGGFVADPASRRAATSPASAAIELELIVTQTPAVSPSQTFTAPGLTLGGQQTWKYVFDFKGLKQQ